MLNQYNSLTSDPISLSFCQQLSDAMQQGALNNFHALRELLMLTFAETVSKAELVEEEEQANTSI